jgi:hypothetical protein
MCSHPTTTQDEEANVYLIMSENRKAAGRLWSRLHIDLIDVNHEGNSAVPFVEWVYHNI